MDTTSSIDINEIASFIINNSQGLYNQMNWNIIKNVLKQHIDYKTIIILRDKEGILATCRWNVTTKDTVHVLDLIIREGQIHKQIIKRMLLKGLRMYPDTKFIEWEREKKYPDRKRRQYLISDILKRRR